MKNKLIMLILFLMTMSNGFAQTDSLKVYLEKNHEQKFGVDLVFENNHRDTVVLLTQFQNFEFTESMQGSGIYIEFYYNDKKFVFNWGDGGIEQFDFFKGYAQIAPDSKIRMFFNVRDYYSFPEYTDGIYEIGFYMSYLYVVQRDSEEPRLVRYFRTNRVTVLEPPKEEPENDNPCPDAEK